MKGCIYKRGDRKWSLVIDLPRGTDGKRKQKWHTVEGTKAEAQRELTRLLHELNTGLYVEPAKLTVGELLEKWVAHKRSTKKAASTLGGYESYVRTHLAPGLGSIPLPKLTPLAIQQFYAKMLSEGRKDGKGALSPRTVKHAHVILHTALAQAVKWQYLARNPCDAVDTPDVQDEELHAFTEAQVESLLGAVKGTPLSLPVLLAVATGCRRGELCGLRWDHIDLDRGQLVVCRAAEVTKEGVRYKDPKTRRSRRGIPLPGFAVEALRRHKGQQAERRLLMGDAYHPGNHLLTWEDGRPLHPDYISKAFAKTARKLSLPTTRFHALRHTCASVLLKADVHPRIVSDILGHDDIRTTLNIYSHLLPGLAEEAARKLDAALRGAAGR